MESMQAWQQRQDQQEGLLSELKDLMATPTLGRTSLSSAVRQSEDHLGLTCSEAEAQRSKVIFSPLICSILSFKFIALRVTSFDASRQASSASRAPRPRKASSCPHPTPPHPRPSWRPRGSHLHKGFPEWIQARTKIQAASVPVLEVDALAKLHRIIRFSSAFRAVCTRSTQIRECGPTGPASHSQNGKSTPRGERR